MKILFLSRLFYPHIGGVEKHVFEISKKLIEKRHEVVVLTEKLSDSPEHEIIKGIEIKRISVGNDNFFKKFRIWNELLKNIKIIQDADIIHAHDVFFWYLPFRFLYPSKKIFTTFHGYEGNKIPGLRSKFMHKIAEKLSNGNICVGDFLKKWYATKPDHITYGGVEVSSIKYQVLSINKNKLKFLFLGRLEEEAGIMEYLKALKILKGKKYKFELTVLGDGFLMKKAEDYCSNHRINVIFKGFVKNVDSYIVKSDFIFTSRYLGILEALSFRKFIFSVYNNEIKKDYLRMSPFAKYISIVSSHEELAIQIEYYLKNDNRRNMMVEQGFNWVKNETWGKMVDAYLRLWEKN